jgi:amino acid adenylation domain-containing protein
MTLPVQVVLDNLDPLIETVDLTAVAPEDFEQEIEKIRRDIETDAPLSGTNLLRFVLAHKSSGEHVLMIAASPLVADAATLRNLAFEICGSLDPDALPADDVAMQYPDVAAWMNEFLSSADAEAGREFWRRRIGVSSSEAVDIDAKRKRDGMQHQEKPAAYRTISVDIPEDVAARFDTTNEMRSFLLACWLSALHRFGMHSEAPVGVLFDGRSYAELATAMGPIARFVPVAANLQDATVFSSLVDTVSADLAECQTWLECFDPALWNTAAGAYDKRRAKAFEYVDMGGKRVCGSQTIEVENISAGADSFALLARCVRRGQAMKVQVEWDSVLWDAELIGNLTRAFAALTSRVDRSAADMVGTVALLDNPERCRILEGFNQTEADYPRGRLLHELFSMQAARTPDAIAVQSDEESLTYRQLEMRSNQLAHYLLKCGVGSDMLVGICMERSAAMVEALLAVLKAGGAYVPLDPDYPRERLAYMLEDSGAVVLLTQSHVANVLPSAHQICVDEIRGYIAREPVTEPPVDISPENAAYVIYTSGSTGKPKGAMITHRAICNHMLWMQSQFPLGHTDSVLQKTPFSFDASVWEFYAPLMAGARLVMARPAGHQDTNYLAEAVALHRITTLQLVPSVLRALLEVLVPEKCPSLRRLFCGGEALPVELVNLFRTKFPAVGLCNLYGPTETTIDATFWICPAEGPAGKVPIGRPVANTQAYILDAALQPVPCGVAGELYIGGEGLGRGYYNRPDLTADRFIPNPFRSRAGSRLYRTGDLACYRDDGTIDYLGRADHQVKIRGFRIEPGEIQARLAEHPAVSQALVVAVSDRSSQARLAAYLIADAAAVSADVSIDELRRHLAVNLPDYMIPSAFVFLDAFPLTPNGKVDRNALPEPDSNRPDMGPAYRAPRSASEEVLAGLFADLLVLDRVGIDDSFFDLGGHSLLATQLVARIRSAFRVDLPLRAVFEAPSVAALAQRITGSDSSSDALAIPPADRTQPLALSFSQQRLWFLDQLIPDSPLYHIPAAVTIDGPLDANALEHALSQLVARHESLRTRFVTDAGEPVQVIMPAAPLRLHVHDLSSLPDPQPQLDQLIRDAARLPFDLSSGPPARFSLVRLSADRHVLLLTMHHIVADGWSLNVLIEDVLDFYRAHVEQSAASRPEPPIQYADYAVWQRQWLQAHGEAQLDYWKGRLAGSLPVLDLPADRPRPAHRSWQGDRIYRLVPESLTKALAQVSRRHQATMYMTLLAAWKLLLSRYSSQSDILVGTPIANRTRREVESLIGFFVNTLVLRTDLSGDPTFLELLDRVRETCLGAYAHQDLPLEHLVDALQPDRDTSHHPLFQVMFMLQSETRIPAALPGLTFSAADSSAGVSKFDLSLQFAPSGESLQAVIEYSTELFEASTIERMLDHLFSLLQAIASDPGRRLSALSILSDAERHQLLAEFNATAAEYPDDQLIHQLFEKQVVAHPQATALVYENETMSYGELNGRANQLAHHLLKLGIRPDDRVAICIERGPAMMVAMLGILKAGGAYVPLDPNYPADRLAYMLTDSAPAAVVTQAAIESSLPHNVPLVVLDRAGSGLEQQPETNPDAEKLGLTPHHLAYVIYTSGSTGLPKGAMNHHRGLCNLATALSKLLECGVESRVLQFASFSFDSSIADIAMAWCSGASLHLASRAALMPGEPLVKLLQSRRITHVTLPPSALAAIDDDVDLHGITMVLAGEALPPALARKWGGRLRLFNGYGPTEAAVCATMYRCSPDAGSSVPIGPPIANVQIYILDAGRQPVPVGVAGEIFIGGVGVGRGYLNRPELTAGRFIANPFSADPDSRLYKTGDLARWLPDGNIEYIGRNDFQVKIRGFRVELGEIEARLLACEGVREAVVIAREDVPGDKRLVAYLVSEDGSELDAASLRAQLSTVLADFMVPAAFVTLPAFPLNANGKLERRALPAPTLSSVVTRAYEAPRTAVETVLAGIWSELLGVDKLGIHDNFFELGGHSLLATQVVSRIRETFQLELPVRALFEAPTVAGLAEEMRKLYAHDELEEAAELIQRIAGLSEDEVMNMLSGAEEGAALPS